MFRKVKITVVVDLSTKSTKKRGGLDFFFSFEIFQLTVLLFSSTVMTSTAAKRHLFLVVMPVPPVMEKAE